MKGKSQKRIWKLQLKHIVALKSVKNSITFLYLAGIFFHFSCNKEKVCDGCTEVNEPPTVFAGVDQVIIFPTDSFLLDGTTSSDPDGKISEWLWTKISGPARFIIESPTAPKTIIKDLDSGIYKLELKITDNGGLTARDTMQIVVSPVVPSNRPPVANAGADMVITLPVNTVTLDGSGSSDPDNNIAIFEWTKISGQYVFNILHPNAPQAVAINLSEGDYEFELKVTDSNGEMSRDSVKVTVRPEPNTCDTTNRKLVNARLTPFGTLSQARLGMTVASAGNKIVFAGAALSVVEGSPVREYGSSRVDIYDVVAETWTTAELSKQRSDIAAVAAGNKIFFAGGRLGDGAFDQLFSTVDIYDVVSNSWSVASLSQPRAYISAAAVGDKVLFAGGEKDWNYNTSEVVDIYNLSTNGWSVAYLSEARAYISGVTAGNRVYFAGGQREDRWYADPSNVIDIYDAGTNNWSVSHLLVHTVAYSSIHVDNKIYWAGGCPVEIRNDDNTGSTIAQLSRPGGHYSVRKDDKIIFIGRGKYFDIYDIKTQTWSIGVLPVNMPILASVISVNNTIYVAGGGLDDNYQNITNQVWKLEF